MCMSSYFRIFSIHIFVYFQLLPIRFHVTTVLIISLTRETNAILTSHLIISFFLQCLHSYTAFSLTDRMLLIRLHSKGGALVVTRKHCTHRPFHTQCRFSSFHSFAFTTSHTWDITIRHSCHHTLGHSYSVVLYAIITP